MTEAQGYDHTRLGAVLLAGAERPKPPSALRASLLFGKRALLKIRHEPEQLFDVTMFPILFTLMFTFLFGGALAGSPREYVQVLLPGILTLTILMITMYTGATLNKDIEKGVFDRFRTLPIFRPAPIIGALLGDAARYLIAATIILIIGLLIGYRPGGGVVGVILGVLVVIAFAFSLSWLWTFLALILRTDQAVIGVAMLALFPLTFISNIFVEPSTMPGFLQGFVHVNPVTHVTDVARSVMGGTAVDSSGPIALAWAAGFITIFGTLTMWRYNRKL